MNMLEMSAPEPQPRQGWKPLTTLPDFGVGRSYISGDTSANRLRVAYYYHETDDLVYARAWFGWAAEGPPGYAHGGSILAVFDETMGMAVFKAGYLAVAASVTGHFRKKLPLGTDTIVEAKVLRTERRKIYTQATLFSPDYDRVFAEAEGLFVMQKVDQIADGIASVTAPQPDTSELISS